MIRIFLFLLFLLVMVAPNLRAQPVFLPAEHPSYDFLIRIQDLGLVSGIPSFRTQPADSVAGWLKAAGMKMGVSQNASDWIQLHLQMMNDGWVLPESEGTQFLVTDSRWRISWFDFRAADTWFSVKPLGGIELFPFGKTTIVRQFTGISAAGQLYNSLGFTFNYRDFAVSEGTSGFRRNSYYPETGPVIGKSDESSFEYNEIRASVSTDWGWGSASIGKDHLVWGTSRQSIVLSDKAPSFPFVRLDIRPADWIRFNYFHGWLHSRVVDSTTSYPTKIPGKTRIRYRDKYIASHTVFLYPTTSLEVAFGESIIYSDEIKPGYLIPVNFFRLMDHYYSRQLNDAGDNSQFFFSGRWSSIVPGLSLYGMLFIDEISLASIANENERRMQISFDLGGAYRDIGGSGIDLSITYLRNNPFVYEHYIETQTYENQQVEMGHWLGSNSDQLRLEGVWWLPLHVKLLAGTELSRKGITYAVSRQYEQPQPPFMETINSKRMRYSAKVQWYPVPGWFLEAGYQKDQVIAGKNQVPVLSDQSGFIFSLTYGW